MRYIDADALIKDIENCSYETWSKGINRDWWAQAVKVKDNIKRCIERQPTADVVEVVRCKDCRYKDECNRYVLICGDEGELAFCSYGERRDENEG